MAYQSVHTGPEVDAAVSVLSDVQDIRDEVETNLNTVTTLAGQTATNAGLAQTAATNAQADAASALTSRNEAHTSAQAAASSAAASDAARAQSVVAKNGAEQARDSAWEAEDETRALLSESGPTIDAINAELRRMKYGSGPYPSLELGFVGATMLDRRVEFTRASNATYWDSLGTLQTAGPNEPRFDYDPVTGESLGLLLERQATNLVRWSEDLTQALWNKNGLTVTTDANMVTPNGESGAKKLIEDASLGTHFTDMGIGSITAGQSYSFSFFAKRGERFKIGFLGFGNRFTGDIRLGINLETLEPFGILRVENVKIIQLNDGWVKVEGSITEPAETTGSWGYRLYVLGDDATNVINSYQGDGVSGLYVWGAQAEQGTSPTSYIKTEASQVTRASDNTEVSIENFHFSSGSGTLLFEGSLDFVGVGWGGIAALYGPDLEVGFLNNASTNSVFARSAKGGVVGTPSSSSAVTLGVPFKASIAVTDSGAAWSFNGSTVREIGHPVGFSLAEITHLGIGKYRGNNFGGKHVLRVVYYPRALSDAQLVEMTTP